ENNDCANDGDWLLKKITADAGQGHLHDARVISDTRHQKTRAHLVKEIHRMANHLVKKLGANIGDDFVAYPLHKVGIPVRAHTAQSHDDRNGETDKDD